MMELKYYGVWVNISDDVFLGVPVGTQDEVKDALLKFGCEPAEGDNLLIYNAENGVLCVSWDIGDQKWQAE